MPSFYVFEISTAQAKWRKMKQVDADELILLSKGKDVKVLQRLISNKVFLKQNVDSLLNVYVGLLPQDSINTAEQLQFIARTAPLYSSPIDSLMRSCSHFDDAWYAMPLEERQKINSSIINKSIYNAAKKYDVAMATAVAAFALQTYNDRAEGADAYDRNMMRYYELTKNNDRYLAIAVAYYNRRFSRITPEFLKEMDRARESEVVKRGRGTYTTYSSEFQNELYMAASKISGLDKENKYHAQTFNWINRAMAVGKTSSNVALYAKILYKGGQKNEAIKQQSEAIERYKKSTMKEDAFIVAESVKNYTAILEKMKNGTL